MKSLMALAVVLSTFAMVGVATTSSAEAHFKKKHHHGKYYKAGKCKKHGHWFRKHHRKCHEDWYFGGKLGPPKARLPPEPRFFFAQPSAAIALLQGRDSVT